MTAIGERFELTSPRFSFVATSRNDDHGGDVLRRTQSFVKFLAVQAERHQVPCELVLVDWNPPLSRAPLADVLDWPAGSEWFEARVVTVPREVHLTLPNARSLSMFQMIAKNIGIRRARGEFAIATNIDIIFSDELFDWLKTAALDENTLYRSDRWDIPNEIQLEPDFDRLLERARSEAIRKNLAEGTLTRAEDGWRSENLARVDRYLLGTVNAVLEHSIRLLDGGYSPKAELAALLNEILPRSRRLYLTPAAHLNGCGDFTMMSRSVWRRLRGYPEWPVFSWNIDSVTLIHAAYEGVAHQTLQRDAVHFHIEHDYGSGYTPGGMSALLRRLEQRSTPLLSWVGYQDLLLDLSSHYEEGRRVQFNSSDWGFARLSLPEQTMSTAGQPARHARTTNSGKLRETFAEDGLAHTRVEPWDAACRENHALGWTAGDAALLIDTAAPPGEVVASFALPKAWPDGIRGVWIRLWAQLHSGACSFTIENAEQDALARLSALEASDGWRELIFHTDSNRIPARLVARSEADIPLRLDLSPIDVFWPESTEAQIVDLRPELGWFGFTTLSGGVRQSQPLGVEF